MARQPEHSLNLITFALANPSLHRPYFDLDFDQAVDGLRAAIVQVIRDEYEASHKTALKVESDIEALAQVLALDGDPEAADRDYARRLYAKGVRVGGSR